MTLPTRWEIQMELQEKTPDNLIVLALGHTQELCPRQQPKTKMQFDREMEMVCKPPSKMNDHQEEKNNLKLLNETKTGFYSQRAHRNQATMRRAGPSLPCRWAKSHTSLTHGANRRTAAVWCCGQRRGGGAASGSPCHCTLFSKPPGNNFLSEQVCWILCDSPEK